MKTKSLKKLELNKAKIVELNKQDIEALKGQGTCFCNTIGFEAFAALCNLQ